VIHAGYLIRSEVLDRKKKDGKGRFEMEPSEATEEPEPAEPEPVEEPVEVAEEPEEKLITEPKEEPPKVEEVEPVEEISQRTASCFGFEV
jgi:outer membrane biosynthesis protein TonB